MKNKWIILILIQAIISLISGILLSKMSLIGKIGVSTVYSEYGFMKQWYKGFAAVFALQLFLIALLWIVKRLTSYKNFSIVNLVLIILGLLGLFFTYIDFTNTSHKYMNNQFHWGGYLFWIGWFVSCFYFFFARVKPKVLNNIKDETVPTNNDSIDLEENN